MPNARPLKQNAPIRVVCPTLRPKMVMLTIAKLAWLDYKFKHYSRHSSYLNKPLMSFTFIFLSVLGCGKKAKLPFPKYSSWLNKPQQNKDFPSSHLFPKFLRTMFVTRNWCFNIEVVVPTPPNFHCIFRASTAPVCVCCTEWYRIRTILPLISVPYKPTMFYVLQVAR